MSTSDQSLDTLKQSDGTIDEVVWRPTRTFGVSSHTIGTQTRIRKLQAATTPVATTAAVTVNTGVPKALLTITATESPDVQQGRTFSEVSIVFSHDPSDKAYDHVNIWFQGYKGNSQPVLMTSGITSPIVFLTETTKEVVTVYGQVVGSNGSALSVLTSLSCTVALDGVISAPPAPSAGALLSTPFGFQFSFTLLGGLLTDVIDSYRIYRSTTSSFGAATLIQTIKQSPTNSGDVVVQDQMEQYQTRWYWVSSVSTSGLESSATLVGTGISGAVSQGGSGDNLVYNGNFAIYSTPTGTANSFESSPRADDTPGNFCPDGWTQKFDGVEQSMYRSDQTASSLNPNGQYVLVMQDLGTPVTNQTFAAVCDAFPVKPSTAYYFSAFVDPGFGSTFPATATWYFRVVWYGGNSAFDLASAISQVDIVSASTTSGAQRPTKVLIAPSTAAFCRIAFYRWYNASTPHTDWNLVVGDVRCTPLLNSQQASGVTNAYTFTGTSILSQSGTSTTINIAASTAQFGFGQVSYNSGSVNPGVLGTYYVYCNDLSYAGGAVSYLATTSFVTVNAVEGATYFGKITTVGGGGGTGGGGSGGGGGCFTGNVEIKTPSGIRRFDSLPRDERFLINTEFGVRPALLVVHENYSADMLDMGDEKFVTLTHGMKFRGSWRHAVEHFEGCPVIRFEGTVYNLHVCDPDPLTHHYILASGEVAHNFFKN